MYVAALFLTFTIGLCRNAQAKSDGMPVVYDDTHFKMFADAWRDIAESDEMLKQLFEAVIDVPLNERIYYRLDSSEDPASTTVEQDPSTLYATIYPKETSEEEELMYLVSEPNTLEQSMLEESTAQTDTDDYQHRIGTFEVTDLDHDEPTVEEVESRSSPCDHDSVDCIRDTREIHFSDSKDGPETTQMFHVCSSEAENLSGNTDNMNTLIDSAAHPELLVLDVPSELPLSDDSVPHLQLPCTKRALPLKSKVTVYPEHDASENFKREVKEQKSEAEKLRIAGDIIDGIEEAARASVRLTEDMVSDIISSAKRFPKPVHVKFPKMQPVVPEEVDLASEIMDDIQRAAKASVRVTEKMVSRITSAAEQLQKPVQGKHSMMMQQEMAPSMPKTGVKLTAKLAAVRARLEKDNIAPHSPSTGIHLKPKGTVVPNPKDHNKEIIPEIVMRSLEAAASVLAHDVLPATRRLIVENVVKVSDKKY